MKNKNLSKVKIGITTLGIMLTTWGVGLNFTPVIAQENLSPIQQTIIALKESYQPWIEVDLSTQTLTVWEGDRQFYQTTVSTGKEKTPTLPGIFRIQSKHSLARMRGDDYDIPDVPYTLYYNYNYAIHGAYWHHNFGTPVSHGCINLSVSDAKWLFEWASVGTPLIIHE